MLRPSLSLNSEHAMKAFLSRSNVNSENPTRCHGIADAEIASKFIHGGAYDLMVKFYSKKRGCRPLCFGKLQPIPGSGHHDDYYVQGI
jgi:hypothetical protein